MGWTCLSPFRGSNQTRPRARWSSAAARTAVRQSHGIIRGRTRYGWRTKELAVDGVRTDDGELWSDEQHVHRLLPDVTKAGCERIMSPTRQACQMLHERSQTGVRPGVRRETVADRLGRGARLTILR